MTKLRRLLGGALLVQLASCGRSTSTPPPSAAKADAAAPPVDAVATALDVFKTPTDGPLDRAPVDRPRDATATTAADASAGAGDHPADAGPVVATHPWQALMPAPAPAQWPRARSGHALAVDTTRNKLVLFGGAAGGVELDDLWEWDLAAGGWTDRTPSPRAAAWPEARSGHAMAFDSQRGRMVVYGTSNGQGSGETWEWDPVAGSWVDRAPNASPLRRSGSTMVFEPASDIMVLFGGTGAGGALAELWQWNCQAGSWTNLTPSSVPMSWPAARTGHAGAYDPARKKMLIFGGQGPDAAHDLDDLWEWDRASGTWTARTPSPRPVAWPVGRANAAGMFVTTSGKMMIHGGSIGAGVMPAAITTDLWSLDPVSGAWTNRTPSPLPTGWPARRTMHAAVYSQRDESLYVFGGVAGDASVSAVETADLWWVRLSAL
jgi:hypothetical protein